MSTLCTYKCNNLKLSALWSRLWHERVIIWPLLSPLSQFDMMNVQFPLSPHSQLITISINKVRPTSVVDITDQRVTSSDDLSLQCTADFAKSGLI